MQAANWASALLLLLVSCAAVNKAQAAVLDPNDTPDTKPAPQLPNTTAPPNQARDCLLRTFNTTNATMQERKVFSQLGEDGIIESIFGCIGTTERNYVEFGVEDGRQCTTRNLRENHGFSGLMMDGSNNRPEINLQQELMYSHNIVQLFKKYSVPHPKFDHMTVDLDQNTFWVALSVMRAGYRPRSLTVEINRNFARGDSYAVIDMPQEMWSSAGDCYFGASTKAWVVMLRCFGYHLVYVDAAGVNAFFVHNSTVGKEPLLSLADAQGAAIQGGEHKLLHGQCMRHAWVRIEDHVDFADASVDIGSLPVVFLGHEGNTHRVYYEIEVPAGLQNILRSRAGQQVIGPGVIIAQPAASATANLQQQVSRLGHAVKVEAIMSRRAAFLQDWSVIMLVGMTFACGALLQRFGGQLLHAVIVACTGRGCKAASRGSSPCV